MHQGEGIVTPRLEAYEAACRLRGYPQEQHAWLVEWAMTMHRLIHKQESVDFVRLTGKRLGEIRPEDVQDLQDASDAQE